MTVPPVPVRRRRWLHDHPWVVDGALGLLLSLVTAYNALGTLSSYGFDLLASGRLDLVAYLCLFGMAVTTAVARTAPRTSAVVVAGLAVLYIGVADAPAVAGLAVPWVVYALATRDPSRRWSVAGLVAGLAGCGYAALAWGLGRGPVDLLAGISLPTSVLVFGLSAAIVGGAWLVGDRRSSTEALLQAYADRADLMAQEARQQAELAAGTERRRIARDLHDVIAHSLTVMTLQADGARAALARDPVRAGDALEQISRTGRDALRETRGLLGILRDERGDPARAPQPTEADLEDLVRGAPPATLTVSGTPRPLLPGVGLTAYRLVQESLTNIAKHAGSPRTVAVHVHHDDRTVVLEVTDDGRGAGAVGDGQGSGLAGMRERVAGVGGRLATGPRPGGGYVVRAEFPDPYAAADAPHTVLATGPVAP